MFEAKVPIQTDRNERWLSAARAEPECIGKVGVDLGVVGLVEADRGYHLLVDRAAFRPGDPHETVPLNGTFRTCRPNYRYRRLSWLGIDDRLVGTRGKLSGHLTRV